MAPSAITAVERVVVQGETKTQVAKDLGVTRQTVFNHVKRAETLIEGGSRGTITRWTQAAFDQLRPLLETRMASSSIEIVERVVVRGETQTAVAEDLGVTRQAVFSHIKRAETLIAGVPNGWIELNNVWLPPKEAKKVLEKAETLRAKFFGTERAVKKKAP